MFAGFLQPRSATRRRTLVQWATLEATLIFFESPQRLGESLADMAEILGARDAAVAREITKLHEEFRVATLTALAENYSGETPKGEITIIVGPPPDAEIEALITSARGVPFWLMELSAELHEASRAGQSESNTNRLLSNADTLQRRF